MGAALHAAYKAFKRTLAEKELERRARVDSVTTTRGPVDTELVARRVRLPNGRMSKDYWAFEEEEEE
jgi:hypothetical protein